MQLNPSGRRWETARVFVESRPIVNALLSELRLTEPERRRMDRELYEWFKHLRERVGNRETPAMSLRVPLFYAAARYADEIQTLKEAQAQKRKQPSEKPPEKSEPERPKNPETPGDPPERG